MTAGAGATRLRELGTPAAADGCRVLGDQGAPAIEDELAQRLLGLLAGADDVSSSSPELLVLAADWPVAAALSPARAGALRALDLPADATVLEIGCGYGALTRYLGERCATVDALEAAHGPAAVARARTRDLPGVEVFVGALEQVPVAPAYDVVVVMDAFADVGEGTAEHAPYIAFLRRCRALLRDGGTLVLGTANPLGVKYLAGAVDEHTGRPLDSLEGYALGTPARSFPRRTLEQFLDRAGFTARFLAVFPDLVLPRAVMSDALFEASDQLATGLPRFPSPDHVAPRLQLADEGRTWAEFVRAGVGRELANGFLVLASAGGGTTLWPDSRLAALLVSDRQPEYAVRGEVRNDGDGLRIVRQPLYRERIGARAAHPAVRHAPAAAEPVRRGRELLDAFLEQPARRPELLRRWVALVPDEDWAPVDLLPHNVVLTDDDELETFDQEWRVQGYDRGSVLLRGLFLTAVQMAVRTRPEELRPSRTVRELLTALASEADMAVDDEALVRFVAHESAFQAAVNATDPDERARREHSAADLRELLDRPLSDLRGGDRFDVQWNRAREDIDNLYAALRQSDEQHQAALAELRAEVAATAQELAEAREREAALLARRPSAVARRGVRTVLDRSRLRRRP